MTGQSTDMKLLLVVGEIPDVTLVRELAGAEDVEVYVVAPALQDSALRFWVSDVDAAIGRARQVQQEAVAQLRDSGVPAAGTVGEAEPLQAALDALAVFPADRVLILAHEGDEQAYREDELAAARTRLGVPVDVHRVARSAT